MNIFFFPTKSVMFSGCSKSNKKHIRLVFAFSSVHNSDHTIRIRHQITSYTWKWAENWTKSCNAAQMKTGIMCLLQFLWQLTDNVRLLFFSKTDTIFLNQQSKLNKRKSWISFSKYDAICNQSHTTTHIHHCRCSQSKLVCNSLCSALLLC